MVETTTFRPPPFTKDDELEKQLRVPESSEPFACQSLLNDSVSPRGGRVVPVPGYPLHDARKPEAVQKLLARHLLTPRLDAMHPVLHMVSTKSSNNVNALHHQFVRGREIVLAEDPGLHLVWYYDKIYIKPIPRYLLSHAFWSVHLSRKETTNLRMAALGFLRTYVWLIQTEWDFELARSKGLVPPDVSFVDCLYFLDHFRHVIDDEVSFRYRGYGQLRLSRLNLWSKVYEGQMFYHNVDAQYGAYFSRFAPPFLFLFGLVSVALSGMSVVLAVDSGESVKPNHDFAAVAKWFSIVCLFGVALALLFFPLLQTIFLLREWVYLLRHGKTVELKTVGSIPTTEV